MFGQPFLTNAFSLATLRQLVNSGRMDDAKQYMKSFFAKVINPIGVMFYIAPRKELKLYTREEVKSTFIQPSLKYQNGEVKFSASKWFFEIDDELFTQNLHPQKPLVYDDNGLHCLNMFGGFRFETYRPYSDFDETTKKGVELIFTHIKTALCSNNMDLYKYARCWVIRMICGFKNHSMLYWKSLQGVGKTIIFNFFHSVLGSNAVVRLQNNTEPITGNYNSELCGKTLMVVEELQATTKAQWMQLSTAFRGLVTDPKLRIRALYKDPFATDNFLNIILASNNNALGIPLDDRRTVCMDVSNKFIGNTSYFKKLADTTDSEEVQECFYSYCKEMMKTEELKNFRDNVLPQTQFKQDMIVGHLPPILQFIKDKYLLNHKGIDEPFKTFYEAFNTAYGNEKSIDSKFDVSRSLKDHNIPIVERRGHQRYICLPKMELIKMYASKHWIHELDEFEDDDYTRYINENKLDIERTTEPQPQEEFSMEMPKKKIHLKKVPKIDIEELKEYIKKGRKHVEAHNSTDESEKEDELKPTTKQKLIDDVINMLDKDVDLFD